jgi:hypothetical protein
MRRFAFWLELVVALGLTTATAHALDKQGSAHGGKLEGDTGGWGVSGSVVLGAAVYNPSYAARPDNSGHALLRLAPHADIDVIGRRLSIPIDVNLFSDRDRSGVKKLLPTELDVIGGLTSTWALGVATAVELGVRAERDMPVDRGSFVQSYGDARLRLLYSMAPVIEGLDRALQGGDIAGALTLGWFMVNSSYAARPDNTGIALFRYGASAGVSFWDHRLGVGVDLVSFSDRRTNAVRPSELDATPSILWRLASVDLQLAYERDMPLDRSGLVQQLVLFSLATGFDFHPSGGSEKPSSNAPSSEGPRPPSNASEPPRASQSSESEQSDGR